MAKLREREQREVGRPTFFSGEREEGSNWMVLITGGGFNKLTFFPRQGPRAEDAREPPTWTERRSLQWHSEGSSGVAREHSTGGSMSHPATDSVRASALHRPLRAPNPTSFTMRVVATRKCGFSFFFSTKRFQRKINDKMAKEQPQKEVEKKKTVGRFVNEKRWFAQRNKKREVIQLRNSFYKD